MLVFDASKEQEANSAECRTPKTLSHKTLQLAFRISATHQLLGREFTVRANSRKICHAPIPLCTVLPRWALTSPAAVSRGCPRWKATQRRPQQSTHDNILMLRYALRLFLLLYLYGCSTCDFLVTLVPRSCIILGQSPFMVHRASQRRFRSGYSLSVRT